MRRLFRVLNCLLIAALLFGSTGSAFAQAGGEDEFVARLIAQMSPEAKVGQLFVVSFNGIDTTLNSEVADLILNYRVGGVVLSIPNGNIVNGTGTDTPTQVATLTAALQNLAKQTNRTGNAPFIPLFIATEQDGDGPPNSQITTGLTPLPSLMAIGATWNADDAEKIGEVAGKELSAIGINLLLGPSLDVRTSPSNTTLDPGVNVFGGDPYWVGVMAQAYVRGLRAGSADRLATVLKNFPGQGNLDTEAYTIDRSLDDLKKIDLPPFLRLLQVPTGKTRPLADALLTTNVRYRGFSGNIRERTRPISLDNAALQTLIDLPDLKAWRDASGLMVSDAVGAPMVRDYYATAANAGVTAQQAALESFQAGNDMLILRNLNVLDASADEATLTRGVINFFQQKYSTDPAFQARVDSAVQRVLRLKYRLYPNYDPAKVAVSIDGLSANLGTGRDAVTQVATDALTLLYPLPDRLTLPAPKPEDTFLIAADDHLVQDCKTCPPRSTLTTDELAQAIEKQYGVPTENITSTRFIDLKAFAIGAPNAIDLTEAVNKSTWIVLAMQANDPNVPSSDAAQTLIDLRLGLLTNKRVIGFLFGPPQGLTLEQLSHFSAVYAVYSKAPPFIDVAVKALAAHGPALGRSPVNLAELNYDLTVQTEPDPTQVIQLSLGDEVVEGQPTPAPVNLRVGDNVRIRTNVILDRNGHAVPDGTPVRFTFQFGTETVAGTAQTVSTQNGVARAEFILDRVGVLFVRASSEPALSSITIQISISGPGGVGKAATLLPPTPTFTPSPATVTPIAPTPTMTPTPEPSFMQSVADRSQRANWSELIFALIGVVLISGGSLWRARHQQVELSKAVQVAVWAAIGGLIAYVLFAAGILASGWLRSIFGGLAVLLVTIIGGTIASVWVRRNN